MSSPSLIVEAGKKAHRGWIVQLDGSVLISKASVKDAAVKLNVKS